MKLSKIKKILLLGATLAALTTSIAVPIVLLNKDENNNEKDINKVFKILEEKKDKTIILASDSTNKIIANNQEKIITKLKKIIGNENLKEVKIEILMVNDTNISTTSQKIIIKLTKNEISREIKNFLVKRAFTADEDIAAIKNILDSKIENDLIITLPSSSTGTIIGSRIVSGSIVNKIAIEKELRKLIDPSNTNGNPNHASLRGTSIQISKSPNAPISTIPQDIVVSISKSGGTTLRTTNTFQVKRAFTPDEDIAAIKKILESKTGNDLIITLPSSSTGSINDNRAEVEKKLMILIDPSNINGDYDHASLRGTSLTFFANDSIAIISTTPQPINVLIRKSGGTSFVLRRIFRVKKST